MLFYSFFKTLVGKPVAVELKNGVVIRGDLTSVDQFTNLKLENIQVVDDHLYPHMSSVSSCLIRGSVVRYVHLRPDDVDCDLLQDATRREADRHKQEAAAAAASAAAPSAGRA
ncbi:hypothetical protein H696_04428 [Fonticula alba]|uniref:Sm domain-containing protein n=1 Tax=Fonticula alba TaxID=691883 RepID=A0A058Z527_FONAL|nr:hypothetical protein H696_04428 [Fonticula alba]KCV69008.1 hypothetical protein H696_04428 [Fonticula alba]|eukprot:XP_009496579.1 hypothetical protein H696_04428 [Fonticula alba]